MGATFVRTRERATPDGSELYYNEFSRQLALIAIVAGASGFLATMLWTLLRTYGFETSSITVGGISAVYEKLEATTAPSTTEVVVSSSSTAASSERTLADEVELKLADELRMEELWSQAQKRLDLYHQLATSQSRVSFRVLMAVATMGLALLGFVVWRASMAETTAGALVSGGIGAAGAALATYIGRTFQSTYRDSTNRLTEYFSQPLELTRLLAAERLLHRLRATSSEEGVLMIIEAALKPGREITHAPTPGKARRSDRSSPSHGSA